MSIEVKDLITDLLNTVDPFKDSVSHIMMKPVNGVVVGAARARDGSISIMAKSRGEVPGYDHVSCLGSLSYLRTGINSSYMEKGTLTLKYGEASDGKTQMLRSIDLEGTNGFHVFYQATDPFINKLNRIKMPTDLTWPVGFVVDSPFIKNFEEILRVHQQAPKMGTDLDDIFTLAYADNKLYAMFGERGHQATVTLTEAVEAEAGVDKLNALFSISKMRAILKLIDKGDGEGYLSDKAMKIDTETKVVSYQFVTTAKKVRK